MEYGPCGGVEFNGDCEIAPHRCVFLDTPTVRWHGIPGSPPANAPSLTPVPSPATDAPGATRTRALLASRPMLVADFPSRALDAASITETAALLAGHVDVVLAGDSGAARVQFSPSYRAHLIRSAGVDVWTGINCRDRNRVAIEGELAGLAHVEVAGVHCVTGDHTQTGMRPDAMPVFDLDSTEAASLARAAGHLVSVGESPTTPPRERRASRLLEKMHAGAEICFVNHAGGANPVARFIAEAQDLGATMGFVPCLPMIIDHASAELLASFPSVVLPEGYAERILAARDPLAEGISAAVELAEEFLLIEGVVGVNLSGGPGPGQELHFAEALARIGDELALAQRSSK